MSRIVRINEGGLARAFSGVQKLRTPLSGGGNCLWIPEDAVMLGTKSVNSGGVYNAENDGLYGYSQFNVNIGDVNSLCGIDTDGNYKWLRKINGAIYSSGLPTEIRVTTPPTKTSYHDGETIDYSGMVVKAYDKDGNLWTSPEYPNGVVPLNELIINNYGAIAEQRSGTITYKPYTSEPHIATRTFTAFSINNLSFWYYTDENNYCNANVTDGKAVIFLGRARTKSSDPVGILPIIYMCNNHNTITLKYNGESSFSQLPIDVEMFCGLEKSFRPIETDLYENPPLVYLHDRDTIYFYNKNGEMLSTPTSFIDYRSYKENDQYIERGSAGYCYRPINVRGYPQTGGFMFFTSLLSGYDVGALDMDGYDGAVNDGVYIGVENFVPAILWVALYGNLDKTVYNYTVEWSRPGDNRILKTNLEIDYV